MSAIGWWSRVNQTRPLQMLCERIITKSRMEQDMDVLRFCWCVWSTNAAQIVASVVDIVRTEETEPRIPHEQIIIIIINIMDMVGRCHSVYTIVEQKFVPVHHRTRIVWLIRSLEYITIDHYQVGRNSIVTADKHTLVGPSHFFFLLLFPWL